MPRRLTAKLQAAKQLAQRAYRLMIRNTQRTGVGTRNGPWALQNRLQTLQRRSDMAGRARTWAELNRAIPESDRGIKASIRRLEREELQQTYNRFRGDPDAGMNTLRGRGRRRRWNRFTHP